MKGIVYVLIFLLSSAAWASERSEKIKNLMEAQGLTETFDQQMNSGREQARIQADQMLQQVMNGLRPNPEIEDKLKTAALDYIAAMQAPWTAQDVVDAWARHYGSRFTDAELDQLIAHYRSPLGQKDVLASREALEQFSAEFRERYKPISERATQSFVERVQQVVKECHCQK